MKRIPFFFLLISCWVPGLYAEEESEPGMRDLFFDPEDGMLDVSAFLGTAQGFLPLGTVVTEPAVGYGFGMGLLFLHDSIENRAELMKTQQMKRLPPPSVTGAGGVITENGTWAGGIFHAGFWKDDTVRYLGGAGYVDAKLDFYGLEDLPRLSTDKVSYELTGAFLIQQLLFRLGDSNFFAGANFQGSQLDASFAESNPLLDSLAAEFTNIAVGGVLQWDSRDNIFSTNQGTDVKLEVLSYQENLGGDEDFTIVNTHLLQWVQLHPRWVLGLRGEARTASDDTPFYMLPYVDLRGVPALKFQGYDVGMIEAELRWDFHPRWSAVGFGGVGWAGLDGLENLGETPQVPAGGVGWRYLISKLFEIRTGMDFAWSEEDFAFYFTTGSGW